MKSIEKYPLHFRVDKAGEAFIGPWQLYSGSKRDLLDFLGEMASCGEPVLAVTPNVDQVLNLRNHDILRQSYDAAALRIVDGSPLLLLSRALGAKSIERITGADLLVACTNESQSRGWRIAVLGGTAGAGIRATKHLADLGRTANLKQIPLPYLPTADHEGSIEGIKLLQSYSPHVVFICLGSPKQENWFLHWKHVLPNAVYVGAGAAIDFAAGDLRRAPLVLRRSGFEWLWRLLMEPRRLSHRYLVKGPAFIKVAVQSWRLRSK